MRIFNFAPKLCIEQENHSLDHFNFTCVDLGQLFYFNKKRACGIFQ